jgi:head-tail adaptor
MTSNRLDNFITIRRPTKSTPNSVGEQPITWTDIQSQIPANIREMGASEKSRNGLAVTDRIHLIEIRYVADFPSLAAPDERCRVILDAGTSAERILEIQSAVPSGRRDRVIITAVEERQA